MKLPIALAIIGLIFFIWAQTKNGKGPSAGVMGLLLLLAAALCWLAGVIALAYAIGARQ